MGEYSIMDAFGCLDMEEENRRMAELEEDKSLSMGNESEKENSFLR